MALRLAQAEDCGMNEQVRELLQLEELLRSEVRARKKSRGMDFYAPNDRQMRAHLSTAKTIAYCGGNRSGKSTMGAMEVAWAVTKKYPDWFPKERRFDRPVKIRIATDRFFKIDSVIEPKLREYLPAGEMKRIRRSPQGYLVKIHTKDGSFVEFLTMEQDEMAFEGMDLDLFWGDEPVERKRYIATQRGLVDRGGQTILTFTPLIHPWMKEEIVDKADGIDIDVVTADIRDNMFDINGEAILKEKDIRKFEKMLTEDERETRLHGKFFHLRGVVYKEFNPAVHCVTDFQYSQRYPVVCVLDPHDRLPHWVIWAMVDRVNDIYVMYEMLKEGTVKELASYIRATEKYFGWNVVKRLIDPNFGRKPLISSGMSMIEELFKYGVTFSEADDAEEEGRLKVKEYLHYDNTKPIDINNRPKLYFVKDRAQRTIHSVMNLQYDEWRSETDRDAKEETKQKDTHGADTVKYLCMTQPTFYSPQTIEPSAEQAYY